MEEQRMEKLKLSPKRVFINNIDSYASKNIAKCLCACVAEAPVDSDGEIKTEEEEKRETSNRGGEALSDSDGEIKTEEEEKRETSNRGGEAVFNVVGTVSDKSDDNRPYVLEEYLQPNREELLSKLMDCDVVIYNISQHSDQLEEALWAVSALHNEMDHFSGPKMFILVSTVMTWACSNPLSPDAIFTDEEYRKRRPHPNFTQHIDLERRVVKMGKTNRTLFSTYVVASGLQYGMGEQVFHFFFKTSWLGQEHEIPVFGDGSNVVPTIHVTDLASVIQNVIEHQPKKYYLLAVDNSNNTMEEIVKAVASVLGPGKIQKRPFEESFLTQDLSVMEIDSLLVNLCMEAIHVKELFSMNWLCESGLVENIELIVEEYRQSRGLLPIRLCVLGPPAVGKSTVSKQICRYYKLHHVTLKETISETIAQLEDNVKNADPDGDNDDFEAEAKKLLNSLKENMEHHGDELLVKVVKDKLMSNPCRNQGFVLDGFPKTYEQARELFYAEDESEDGTSQMSSYKRKVLPEIPPDVPLYRPDVRPFPRSLCWRSNLQWISEDYGYLVLRSLQEFVFCLDASDAFLKDRVMNLPERQVQEHNYNQEHFLQQLARYRENNAEDDTVVNYFDEMNITPLCLEITSSNEPDCLLLMQKIFDTVGQPRNYGPSSQEVEEEERRKAEEKMRREAQEKAEEERREAEEAKHRAACWEEWTRDLEEVRQQEEELLEAQSVPMRNYLMEHVMPTLTQGLIQCCTVQPQDPVDFLAEFLIKKNPFSY